MKYSQHAIRCMIQPKYSPSKVTSITSRAATWEQSCPLQRGTGEGGGGNECDEREG
jgi:hypothetical protein